MYKIFSKAWLTLQMHRARFQGTEQKTTAGWLKELIRDLNYYLLQGRKEAEASVQPNELAARTKINTLHRNVAESLLSSINP